MYSSALNGNVAFSCVGRERKRKKYGVFYQEAPTLVKDSVQLNPKGEPWLETLPSVVNVEVNCINLDQQMRKNIQEARQKLPFYQ